MSEEKKYREFKKLVLPIRHDGVVGKHYIGFDIGLHEVNEHIKLIEYRAVEELEKKLEIAREYLKAINEHEKLSTHGYAMVNKALEEIGE